MTKAKLPVAKYSAEESPLTIGGFEMPCYVLDTGQRVLSQGGMLNALGIKRGGSAKAPGDRLARFANQERLKPFITKELLIGIQNPVQFVTKKGVIALGYDAEVLQGIVRGVAKAYLQNKLQKQQRDIGKNAEALDDAFSKVGVIALIDEATGYQYDRERQELQTILQAYISKDLLPWQRKFPDDFYKEIFRLNGWPFTVTGIKNRPGVVGHWTNQLIYDKLPRGVLRELKNKTPKTSSGGRAHRFHQLLTKDIGHPHLEKQLVAVTTLMKVSSDWGDFLQKFQQLYGQQLLPFPEPIETIKRNQELSSFNKKLVKAIGHSPKSERAQE